MGNGYPAIPSDELGALRSQLQDAFDRITELERPSGTQSADLLSTYKANLISPAAGSASASNFVVSTSYTTYATFNFTVPTGFTRALIVANGFVHQATTSGTGERFWGQILINGVGGPESTAICSSSGLSGSVAAGYSVSLSGLTAGQVIAVAIRGHFQVGANSALFQQYNSAVVTAAATYLS